MLLLFLRGLPGIKRAKHVYAVLQYIQAFVFFVQSYSFSVKTKDILLPRTRQPLFVQLMVLSRYLSNDLYTLIVRYTSWYRWFNRTKLLNASFYMMWEYKEMSGGWHTGLCRCDGKRWLNEFPINALPPEVQSYGFGGINDLHFTYGDTHRRFKKSLRYAWSSISLLRNRHFLYPEPVDESIY